ncbi:MAG: hypothetical protein HOH66_07665 [Rhodospirillaceae bacterium]|jgi:hypothetical protein|nr:hypothetical protein [Rhodospirillaceae bacterium]MBT6117729.1 hypothetical protein [Rhodospirillaceae bacterium]
MTRIARYLGQIAVYALFAAVIGYFSNSPAYTHLPADRALIKLSFSHGGAPISECRRLSAEEIAALPPNMRRPLDCPRERVPVVVELTIDGDVLYSASLPPAGLSGDGQSRVYTQFVVPPGPHRVRVRLRDTARTEGFDYEAVRELELRPLQNFVIDFRAERGGFIFE